MESINVRIPEEQKKDVEEKAEKENYPSPSEWIREAIREKIKERDKTCILKKLKEFLKYGRKRRKARWNGYQKRRYGRS